MRSLPVLALLVLISATSLAQVPSANAPVVVTVTAPTDPSRCQMHSFITGKFGGVGSSVRPTGTWREWQIPSAHEGVPADSLKAYLYCVGFRIQTLEIARLDSAQTRQVHVESQPSPSLPGHA